MKAFLALLPALLLAQAACAHRLGAPAPSTGGPAAVQRSSEAWHETVAEEGFAFSMPRSPDVQRQNIQSDAGRLLLLMYIHESPSAAFNVTVARYPDGFLEARDPAKILAGARDGAARQIGGEVLEQRDLQLFSPDGGVAPGLEIVLAAPEGTLYRGRIFVIAGKLIQLSYVSTRAKGSELDYQHFVESFILTPDASPEPLPTP